MYDCPPEDHSLPGTPYRDRPSGSCRIADGGYGVYQDDRDIVLRFEHGLFAHLILVDGFVVHVAVGTREDLTAGLPAGLVLVVKSSLTLFLRQLEALADLLGRARAPAHRPQAARPVRRPSELQAWHASAARALARFDRRISHLLTCIATGGTYMTAPTAFSTLDTWLLARVVIGYDVCDPAARPVAARRSAGALAAAVAAAQSRPRPVRNRIITPRARALLVIDTEHAAAEAATGWRTALPPAPCQ